MVRSDWTPSVGQRVKILTLDRTGTVISVDGITDEGAIFVQLDTAARAPSESGTDAETAYNQLERAGPYIPEELEPVD
jgi:hypothetical protein